ncbi:hypothetical protein B7P43_G09068 [Cryptotermes secundus]|uniref:Uncharacterized protein n=1 Tax=Cryptotermes secundus TaxID=105785 RepID=A0A2J7PLE3_9NEOP|nr:hypothetical protein B7P43_G09068 [Cryptotermes secundus]
MLNLRTLKTGRKDHIRLSINLIISHLLHSHSDYSTNMLKLLTSKEEVSD